MTLTDERASRLLALAIERRNARGENVRCPICDAGIAKPCAADVSHSARIALAKGR